MVPLNFDLALQFTLQEETGGDPEGGYNDRPSDRGGPTKWGIAQHAHPGLNIRDLTRQQAIDLYRHDYWIPARCDLLLTPVAIAQFDCAVNSGPSRAARILQRLVSAREDGNIGPDTLARAQSMAGGRGWEKMATLLVVQRWRFITSLVDEPEDPRERAALRNIGGWGARLIRLSAYCQACSELFDPP